MAPPREPVYAKDEKVLCFHHEFLYEAKVMESRLSDSSDKKSPLQYRVHYKGWKSTWDDWVPQDRLRKLTEENKQLATNLKREIDEMNPRVPAKSTKSGKKKTAGSDFSSARGSEERQSLPPGRGQKRGRDNEIEKVRSSISSTSSPSRTSHRTTMSHEKALEPVKLQETSLSTPKRRHKITLRLSSLPNPLLSPIKSNLKQQAGKSNKQVLGISGAKGNTIHAVKEISTASVSAEPKPCEAEIDLDFWLDEAALLGLDFSYGPMKFALQHTKAQTNKTNISKVNKPLSTTRVFSNEYLPLDQVSDSVLANKVSKMLRHKAKTIGNGLDAPWPTERSKGPQRHPKWLHTLHVDSHNHAKLAFYAEISPTANPVIAGFPPESAPDFVPRPENSSATNKKRKAKIGPSTSATFLADQHAMKRRRRRSSSPSSDVSQRPLVQDNNKVDEEEKGSGDQTSENAMKDPRHPTEVVDQAKDINQGFQFLMEQLLVEDSGEETNSELEQEEHFHARPAVKIEVPDNLKAILVDDWENVTKNLALVPIPAEHPVSEILSTYFEEEKGKRRLGSAEADLLEEVVQGTRDYFEQCLGKLLLYRFEREQYFRLHQAMEKGKDEFEGRPLKDKKIGDIYGAEHLCRLFVSLPELIAQTNMDAQSVSKLRQEIQALTAWLGKNSSRFFAAEYEVAPQEYVEKARGL